MLLVGQLSLASSAASVGRVRGGQIEAQFELRPSAHWRRAPTLTFAACRLCCWRSLPCPHIRPLFKRSTQAQSCPVRVYEQQ